MFYKCLIKNFDFGYEKTIISNISWKYGLPDYMLQTLNEETRYIFIGFASVFSFISVVANVATIIVNTRRKMRTFFRITLYSLAASDLITTIFSTTGYISQLSTKFIQIWHLGDIMCACIPFMSTAAILINSMTLVAIAFDRYMAVVKVVSGVNWEPGVLCCFAFVILVWGMSAGLASPMLMSYYTGKVLLIITNPNSPNVCIEAKTVEMCASDKALNSYYFIIVFSVVFIPMVLTFIWLNSVVAIEIWSRRKFNKNVPCNATKNDKFRGAITTPGTVLMETPEPINQSKSVAIKSIRRISIIENIPDDNKVGYIKNESNLENSSDISNSIKNLASPSTLKTMLENSISNIDDNNDIQDKFDSAKVTVSVNISNIQSTSAKPKEIISTTVGVQMQCTVGNHQLKIQNHHELHNQPLSLIQNLDDIKHSQNYQNHKRRKTRQLRLFIVIILLIAIFLICRLPTWIFLLMRVYGIYNLSIHWVLHYSFGILSLFNCVLNPFCYTFMAETTRFICCTTKLFKSLIKRCSVIILKPFFCLWFCIINKFNKNNNGDNNSIEISKENNNGSSSVTGNNKNSSLDGPDDDATGLEIFKMSNNNKSSNKIFLKRIHCNCKTYNCDQDASYAGKEIYTIFHEK